MQSILILAQALATIMP